MTKIKIYKRPANGLLAEADVSKPHIEVPKDGAILEVSDALGARLVIAERAEFVRDADDDPELKGYEPPSGDEDKPGDPKPPVVLSSLMGPSEGSSRPSASESKPVIPDGPSESDLDRAKDPVIEPGKEGSLEDDRVLGTESAGKSADAPGTAVAEEVKSAPDGVGESEPEAKSASRAGEAKSEPDSKSSSILD